MSRKPHERSLCCDVFRHHFLEDRVLTSADCFTPRSTKEHSLGPILATGMMTKSAFAGKNRFKFGAAFLNIFVLSEAQAKIFNSLSLSATRNLLLLMLRTRVPVHISVSWHDKTSIDWATNLLQHHFAAAAAAWCSNRSRLYIRSSLSGWKCSDLPRVRTGNAVEKIGA